MDRAGGDESEIHLSRIQIGNSVLEILEPILRWTLTF